MRISTRSRYGTRLMLELALNYNKSPVFLKDIAKNEDISEKYLSQIIIPLRTAGLVSSIRGAHGGYILAKQPIKVTVKDIVQVLEGDLILIDCLKRSASCKRVNICVTQDVWCKLGKTISDTLEKITLQDLVNQVNAKSQQEVSYSI